MGSNMEGNWQLLAHYAAEKPIIAHQGSSTFKRTFPLDSSGVLNVSSPTVDEELLLLQHSGKYTGMKLLRGLWQEPDSKECSGTFFPLAAPEGGKTWWCSAGHCLISTDQVDWCCGHGSDVMKGRGSSVPAYRKVVDLSWLTDGLEESELSEVTPSDPSRPIPYDPLHDVRPDFGFMHTTRLEFQPELLFIPCADELTAGKQVCLLGFAAKPTEFWAEIYLRTEKDYKKYKAEYRGKHNKDPPHENDWLLDSATALRRILDMLDVECFPNRLAAAPGKVVAATERMVEHTCSSFPGMSGGPGVDILVPWKLFFVHTRADSDFRRNVNYGYNVNHPLFVKAYVKEILPKLLDTPLRKFQPGMLQCLHHYLLVHKNLLEDAAVLERVAQLMLVRVGEV